ncbi:MAG: MASE1 domain-containing protein, partial [Planctomycetaceae bacterium]|nr:MASE1 domain-containing protein [Planctomycetaceae bacterium]
MIEETYQSKPNAKVGSDQPLSITSLLIRSILFGLTFWGTALGSKYLTVSLSIYVPFWFPSSVYLAVLLLNPVRTWPFFLVTAFIANAAFDLPQGTPISALIGFYLSNSIQVLLAAWLIHRYGELRNALRNLREFFKLVAIIAGVAPVIGALLGAGTLVASRLSPSFVDAWATWFANAALADLLVVPLVLAWFDKSKKISELDLPYQCVQFSILAIGMVITACYVLVMVDGIMSPYKFYLLSFPLLAALRLDLRCVTLMNLSLGILAAFFTAHFQTGLTPRDIASETYIDVLQGFLAVASLVALLPAIVIAERDCRAAELLNSQQRTRLATETTGVGIWEWNLENGDVKWDAAMFQIYGIEPTPDGFVRYETWRECVDPDELADQETILQDTISRKGQSQRQFHIRRRNDQQPRLIQTKEAVRLDAGGKAAYLVGTNIDVTDWHEINSR